MGFHQQVFAVSKRVEGKEISAGALHHFDTRRSCASGPRPQNGGEDEGAGPRRALLRKHRRRPWWRGQQQAGRLHVGTGLHVSFERTKTAVSSAATVELGTRALNLSPTR